MAEGSGTTDAGADQLPEKYRGKSAAEIAKMHAELESKLGTQGEELGSLRTQVGQLAGALDSERQKLAAKTETGTTPKERWKKYGERMIIDPESAVSDLAEEIKRELKEEMTQSTTAQLTQNQMVAEFFRQNPELQNYAEIVTVIGTRILEQNPRADFNAVLAETKKQSLAYIGNLRERLDKDKTADSQRRNDAMTTSGGARVEAPLGPEEREKQGEDERKAAIDAELKSMADWKAKKVLPPNARAAK